MVKKKIGVDCRELKSNWNEIINDVFKEATLSRPKDDHMKTKERWNIIREYFEMKNIDYKEVSTIHGGILSKVICMIYILDYTSIYYAVRLGIDPSPINSIDFIKDRL